VKLRSLTEAEARLEFGCAFDVDNLPVRRGVADLIRRILTAQGALTTGRLVTAVSALIAVDAPAVFQSRIKSVMAQMHAAGELSLTSEGSEGLCWLAPSSDITLPDGVVVRLGQEGRDRPDGETSLFATSEASAARPLGDHLGPPDFRFELKEAGFSAWRQACPEDLAGLAGLQDADVAGMPSDGAFASWLATPPFTTRMHTPEFAKLPRQVRRGIALTGTPMDDALTNWVLPASAARDLQEWAGRPAGIWEEDEDGTDQSQEAVVSAAPSDRLIVEAGPGSGKTRVACARIARLIESGASPSRILMVSFTQAAVAELRQRIGGFLSDPVWAGDVQIVTLDSLAGGFRTGFGDAKPPAGFEGGIRAALDLLVTNDRGLTDYLRSFEHVVIDEAQDLTADRHALAQAMVSRLSPACGVTLFEDPAQAIYGWGQDTDQSLSQSLLADTALRFATVRLEHDHRTRTPSLKGMKSRLRALLRSETDPARLYTDVRAAIEDAADSSSIISNPGTAPRSTLILFRSRAELLQAATRFWKQGAPVRVRVTGRQKAVTSWAGAVLRTAEGSSLSRPAFDLLWQDLWPRPAALSSDEAWGRLRSVAGSGREAVDLSRLARRLASASPPSSLALSSTGRTGPVLSTIHGSKGQEAEHVVIALPRAPLAPSSEEARVLFVAATRARTSLAVASARPTGAPSARGRVWLQRPDGQARIEVGRDGDVDVVRTAFPPAESPEITAARQEMLWRISDATVAVQAVRRDGGWSLLADGGPIDGSDLGFLSNALSSDLRAIGRDRHNGGIPGARLKGLFVAGSRTVSLEMLDGSVRFGIVPIVVGLATVYFNAPATGASAGAAA